MKVIIVFSGNEGNWC